MKKKDFQINQSKNEQLRKIVNFIQFIRELK
jgi:hypothetical protein